MSRTAQDPVVLYVRVSVMEEKAGHKEKGKPGPNQTKKTKGNKPKVMRGKAGLCEPRRGLKWQDKTGLNCGAVMVGWSATGESWHCVIWRNKLGEFSGRGELGVSWMGHVTGQGWTKLGAKWCSSGEVWRMRCGEVWRCAITCGPAGRGRFW